MSGLFSSGRRLVLELLESVCYSINGMGSKSALLCPHLTHAGLFDSLNTLLGFSRSEQTKSFLLHFSNCDQYIFKQGGYSG